MSEELVFASEEKAFQHLANLTGKRVKVAEDKPSPLNGMTKQRAKRHVNKILGENTKGFFSDEYWKPINDIFKNLSSQNIDYVVDNTQYKKDESGNPSSKTWFITVSFTDNKDKEQKMVGSIIASGAGSVDDPLDKYDVVAFVN